MQLPPIVRSEKAGKAGLSVSLLRRLAERFQGKEAIVQLTLQYRMHGNICALVNAVCYNGLLKCGTEEVKSRTIEYREGWEGRLSDGVQEPLPLGLGAGVDWLRQVLEVRRACAKAI